MINVALISVLEKRKPTTLIFSNRNIHTTIPKILDRNRTKQKSSSNFQSVANNTNNDDDDENDDEVTMTVKTTMTKTTTTK